MEKKEKLSEMREELLRKRADIDLALKNLEELISHKRATAVPHTNDAIVRDSICPCGKYKAVSRTVVYSRIVWEDVD